MAAIVFDIETAPRSEEEIRRIIDPPEPDKKLIKQAGEFDPSTVKYGLMKDAAKKAAKLEDAKEKWEAGRAEALEKLKQNLEEFWVEQVEKAALSALTGRVVAIGYKLPSGSNRIVGTGRGIDETGVLMDFWTCCSNAKAKGHRLIGHNIFGFDLPFLVQRSFMVGVTVPAGVQTIWKQRLGWDDLFHDTMSRWVCGTYGQYCSLDRISRALGMKGKAAAEGCDGAGFWKLWESDKDDPKAQEKRALAEKYLANDLDMTAELARRLRLL
jgi:hypothetical protein